jgi:protein-disulfide isomerase
MGPSAAVLTIVEFSDFQCPFCKRAVPYLQNVRQRYPGEIAVVYRTYPIHEFAARAALAAECARERGRFEQFHDQLFAESDSIGKKSWGRYAKDVGIGDTLAFNACMSEAPAAASLSADSVAAAKLGVVATPTFLINDLKVVGFPGDSVMEKYVKAGLRESTK